MQIEEAKEICKAIIKNMQEESEFDLNILKLNWNNRIAIETLLNELEKLIEENKYYKNKFEIVQGDNFPKDVQFVIYTKEVFDKFRNMKLAEEPGNAKTITIKGIKK